MDLFQAIDTRIFRLVNETLANPVFDVLMPWASGNPVFFPAVVVAAIILVWKQRARGALCLVLISLSVGVTDGLVCRTFKHAVGRPRPFMSLEEVRRPAERSAGVGMHQERPRETANRWGAGGGDFGAFPSSHAANMFAVAMVLCIYYRRTWIFMVPLAALVAFSRVYNGSHYPSDVLGGAILGAGGAAASVWSLERLWRWLGRTWFPLWWPKLPSLIEPQARPELAALADSARERPPPKGRIPGLAAPPSPSAELDAHWLRLGYLLIAVLLVFRLAYLASGTIQLSGDEAYQWLWSKHLALSYFSKPPFIAYTQFLGTSLWGDTVFGVRFFSPVIGAVLSLALLRFFAREVNGRAGFFLVLIITATPLMAVGATLMTVDPLSVLFWTLAMLAGWRAVRPDGTTCDWLWVGLWMGCGFLSKYTELFQVLCWAVFFMLWPPARRQLRRPGPWLALLINALCALPVLIWNYQHEWITVAHVGGNADIHKAWEPTLKYLGEFLGAEFGLLNPVFFVGMTWAAIAFRRNSRNDPRLVYFFSMGAPVFLVYLLWTFHSRVLPNWIAPSVLPLFCLMVIYWDARWRLGMASLKQWLCAGLAIGLVTAVVLHDTDIIGRVTGQYVPVKLDPLRRVRQWDETARVVGEARRQLLSEGKPVFIITSHYDLGGQISFWLPEAKAGVPDNPLVYYQSSARPENQFYFWPGYEMRKGENAIYVHELNRDKPQPTKLPARLVNEFESVTVLGVSNVFYHGRLVRPLQITVCRNLK